MTVTKLHRLRSRKDNIAVVWQNEYVACIHLPYGMDDGINAGVHSLTAGYDLIYRKCFKQLIHSLAGTDRDQSEFFLAAFSGFDKLAILLPHVFNLQSVQFSIAKCAMENWTD